MGATIGTLARWAAAKAATSSLFTAVPCPGVPEGGADPLLQPLPVAALPELSPVCGEVVEDRPAFFQALLPETGDAWLDRGHDAVVAEIGAAPLPLLLEKGREKIRPDVAVVDVAEIVLHLLDRGDLVLQLPWIERPEGLHRIAEALCGDPHRVVPLAGAGIGDAALVREEVVEPAGDPGIRLPEGVGRADVGPVPLPPLHLLRTGVLDRPDGPGDVEGVHRRRHRWLEAASRLREPQQQARKAGAEGGRGRRFARVRRITQLETRLLLCREAVEVRPEKGDLHVGVPRRTESAGHLPDLLSPPPVGAGLETFGKEREGRPQPPGGDPHPVDVLDIGGGADAVGLGGKALRVGVQDGRTEEAVARVRGAWALFPHA